MTTLNTIIEEGNTPDTEWECSKCHRTSHIKIGECPFCTPDTEWEKKFDELFGIDKNEFQSAYETHIKAFITNLLSSRDTYWKERVRKEVEEAFTVFEEIKEIESRIADEYSKQNKLYSPAIRQWAIVGQKTLDTLLDNLK